MKPTLKYTTKKLVPLMIAVLTLTGISRIYGQAIVTDSIPRSRMISPTMVRVGTDLLGLAHTAINETRNYWEFQGEIDIYRYFITGGYGHETNQYLEDQYEYRSDGTYWRLGADINMIPREAFGSILYFGLRIGKSNFDEELTTVLADSIWGNIPVEASNNMIKARWVEIVTGMKAKVWKNLYLGYALRVKASLKIKNPSDLNIDPFRVPGFGRADQNSFFGINYYIAWQFPFKEKYMRARQP